MSDDQKSLQQIIDFRLKKLNTLREDGVNPYPTNFDPSHTSETIKSNYNKLEGETVKIAGRIMAIRKMGKASFCHIQDGAGRIRQRSS